MIFPDSDDNGIRKESTPSGNGGDELTWKLKSAPVDSLTHFASTVLCNVRDMHGKVQLCDLSVKSVVCIYMYNCTRNGRGSPVL